MQLLWKQLGSSSEAKPEVAICCRQSTGGGLESKAYTKTPAQMFIASIVKESFVAFLAMVDKLPDRSHLREEGFILAHSFNVLQQDRHGIVYGSQSIVEHAPHTLSDQEPEEPILPQKCI